MPIDAKAASIQSDAGGDRKIQIAEWKPHVKNTLRGFFSATLPSGLVFHELMLHESDGKRWIGFPGKPWTDQNGKQQYFNFIRFRDREAADRFRDAVLAALDEYLVGVAQ